MNELLERTDGRSLAVWKQYPRILYEVYWKIWRKIQLRWPNLASKTESEFRIRSTSVVTEFPPNAGYTGFEYRLAI